MWTNRSRKTRFRRAVLPVALGAMVLMGAGFAAVAATRGDSTPNDPGKLSRVRSGDGFAYAPTTRLEPGFPLSPDAAIKQIENGLGGASHISGVTLEPGSYGAKVTLELDRNDDDFTSLWLDELALGDLGELTRSGQSTLSEEFESAEAVGPNSAGASTTTGLGMGAAKLGQEFSSPADSVLRDHVQGVAKKFGLAVESVRVLHLLDSALMVTLTVPGTGKVDWSLDQLSKSIVGDVPNVEGLHIELRSARGDSLVKGSSTYRTGGGGVWFAPGQDDRFGVIHGGIAQVGPTP